MPEQKRRTPEEVNEIMADMDGFLGAAGHSIEDETSRSILRDQAAGEISPEEARRRLLREARR